MEKYQPWLEKRNWKNNKILPKERFRLIMLWTASILCCLGGAWVIYYLLPYNAFIGEYEIATWLDYLYEYLRHYGLWVMLLIVAGLVVVALLLVWTTRAHFRWKKFGNTPLKLDPFPGSIGGDVGGEIELRGVFGQDANLEVTLSLINFYRVGSGRYSSNMEDVVWRKSGIADVFNSGEGKSRLQFCFQVPDGLLESDQGDSYRDYHFWRLDVEGSDGADELLRSYEIPVYETEQQSSSLKCHTGDKPTTDTRSMGIEKILPIQKIGSRLIIRFPKFKKPADGVLGFIGGVGAIGFGIFAWSTADTHGSALYFIGPAFGLFGLGLFLVGLYYLFAALRVVLNGHEIYSSQTMFGYKLFKAKLKYGDIHDVIYEIGSSAKRLGRKHMAEYDVYAVSDHGLVQLAEGLDSDQKAEKVCVYFKGVLEI